MSDEGPSLELVFDVARKLRETRLPFEDPLAGDFLLHSGVAASNLPVNSEKCFGVVRLLQSLIGDTACPLPVLKEGFVELSVFDPEDPQGYFIYVLLTYDERLISPYVKEMYRNLEANADRGIIIPDKAIYRRPYYFNDELATGLQLEGRSELPTLYLGFFQNEGLGSDGIEPDLKVPKFLSGVAKSMSSNASGFTAPVNLNCAILATFPRPISKHGSRTNDYTKGGGLFVYGELQASETPLTIAGELQVRMVQAVMRICHTQMEASQDLMDSIESGRQARSHELRRVIASLDSDLPPFLLHQVRKFLSLVIAFDYPSPPRYDSLADLVEAACDRAAEIAIAVSWCKKNKWEDFRTADASPTKWRAAELALRQEIHEAVNRVTISDSCANRLIGDLASESVSNFYMAVLCLLRNIFSYAVPRTPVTVRLTAIEGDECLQLDNLGPGLAVTLKDKELGGANCSTQTAGGFYVQKFGGNSRLFKYEPTEATKDGDTVWLSQCPLPTK